MTAFSALPSWSSAQSSSTLIFAAWALPRPASLLRPSLSVVFLFLRLFWPTAPLIPTSSSVPSICIILVVFVKWFSFYASLRYLDRKHYLCEALHPGILVPNAQCPLSPFRPGLSTSPHSRPISMKSSRRLFPPPLCPPILLASDHLPFP